MLVVLGVRFWQLFANIWCREAIVNEKGEPVFFVDSCVVSDDFEGPQGTENYKCDQHLTSWDMPFFRHRFGGTILSFLGGMLEHFGTPKCTKLTSPNQQKTRAHFGGLQRRSGGTKGVRKF